MLLTHLMRGRNRVVWRYASQTGLYREARLVRIVYVLPGLWAAAKPDGQRWSAGTLSSARTPRQAPR